MKLLESPLSRIIHQVIRSSHQADEGGMHGRREQLAQPQRLQDPGWKGGRHLPPPLSVRAGAAGGNPGGD
eukprot:2083501-Pleurochrysis_carterae.AAC.9